MGFSGKIRRKTLGNFLCADRFVSVNLPVVLLEKWGIFGLSTPLRPTSPKEQNCGSI
jgi:hypothetical protein